MIVIIRLWLSLKAFGCMFGHVCGSWISLAAIQVAWPYVTKFLMNIIKWLLCRLFLTLITDDAFGVIWLSCMLSVGTTSLKFHGKDKISMGWGRWVGIFKTCCAHMAATMVGYRNGLGQQWVGHFSPWDFRQFFSEDEHSLLREPWLLKAIKWVWLRPWTPRKCIKELNFGLSFQC